MVISEKTSGEADKKHFAFDSILKKMVLSTLKRKIAIVTILQELNEIESDDDKPKPKRGPGREWIRGRERKGAFVNIFNESYVSGHEGFRRFMRMVKNNLMN